MTELSASEASTPSAREISDRIIDLVRRELQTDDELRVDQPLLSYGVDSMQFIGLIGELEQWLGCRILKNPLPGYPTVEALSDWLAQQIAAGKTQLDPEASEND